MAELSLRPRFALGVKAPLSRVLMAMFWVIGLLLLLALMRQVFAWFGDRGPVILCIVFVALPSLMSGPVRLVTHALSITLELDDTELRVYPCGRFRRARVFRLEQIAHIELWQLEERQDGISRCLHLKLVDGSDAFVGPWYGPDHAERLSGYFGKRFRGI